MTAPDELSPAVVAEDLRALADALPFDQRTIDLLTRAAELAELVDTGAPAAEPAPDVEQAPHFGHTQDVIEDALVGAGYQDLPGLADIVFVATEAARDALGICQVCGSGQPGMYPSDPSADGYAGPEECSACDGTGWARALAGAGAPTEPADDRLAAQDAADEEEGHGPWHYLEGGVLCSCGYPVDRDERCTRPRTPEGQHEVLVGALFEAADNLLARFDRGPDKLDVDEAEVADLQAARDALSAWGEANAAALAGSADDTQETTS